jgi:hypothetical protein
MRGANALQARARTYLNEIITIMLAGAVTITNPPYFYYVVSRAESVGLHVTKKRQRTTVYLPGPHPDFQPELSILKKYKNWVCT